MVLHVFSARAETNRALGQQYPPATGWADQGASFYLRSSDRFAMSEVSGQDRGAASIETPIDRM